MPKSTPRKFPPVDYSKLPKEVERIVEPHQDRIIEEASATFDGKQFLFRVPTKISTVMNLSKKDKIEFVVDMPLPKTRDEPRLSIRLKRG